MLDIFLSLQGAFGLGLIVQMCIRILSKKGSEGWELWKFFAIFPVALGFSVWFYDLEGPVHPPNFFLFFAMWVVVVGCIFFRTHVLPKVNELVLLVWNAAVFYLVFALFGFSPLLMVPLVLTLISFFIAILHVKLPRPLQIACMVWFFLLGVYLTIGLFPWQTILELQTSDSITFWEMFFLGNMACYSFTCLVYLFYFVPLPDPDNKYSPPIEEQREYGNLVADKFDETQYHPYATVAIFVILVVIFWGNYHFEFIKDEFLLSFVLAFTPWVGEGVHNIFLYD